MGDNSKFNIQTAEMHLPTRSILLLSENKMLAQRLSSMVAGGDPLYGPFELTVSAQPQNKLWFKETLADLVLLDLDWLPQSGDFSRILTDNGQTAVPIIVLATHKTKSLGRQAVGAGAVDYLIVEELTAHTLCRLLYHAARPALRPSRRPSTSRLIANNSRLQETALRQVQEMTVMHDLAMAGIEATSEDALIERATKIIGETLYPTNFGILLRDETNQSLNIHPAYKIDTNPLKFNHIPLDQGIVGIVATTGKPYRTGDVSSNPHYLEGDTRSHSELCVPIKLEGAILGVINVESEHFNAFSEADEQFLTTLANQVALALQKVRLLTRSQARQAEAEMVREATIALTTSLDQDVILSNLLEHLAKLIPYDTANVMLLESSNRMIIRASRGYTDFPDGQPVENDVIALNEYPLLRELADTQKPILISDTRYEPRWTINPKSPYIRSWIGIPLIAGGITIGCYSMDSASPEMFTQAHLELAQDLALQTAVAIQNIQLLQTTRRHAAELQIVSNLLQDLNAIPDVMEVFPKIAAVLKQIAQCNLVSLLLFDEDKRRARIMAVDQPMPGYKFGTTFDLETAVFATDILNGRIYTKPRRTLLRVVFLRPATVHC